ncbi:hypothetical protein RYX36_031095, partial [Vicia faba]
VIAELWVLSIVGSWANFLTLFYIEKLRLENGDYEFANVEKLRLENGDYEFANAEKLRLEQLQRQLIYT